MMKKAVKGSIAAAAVACVALCGVAFAGVSADEAAKLKSELTPLGGEKAGNADGSIPAWDGGYSKVPPGYKSGQPRPDPFASDKPILTITSANAAQYAAKLDEGQMHLLKKYPDYKIQVYTTRRTASAPQWVYDETFKNATRAKLDGYALSGAYGGIPFPIPKNGAELVWNHALRVRPEALQFVFNTYTVDSKGVPTLASTATNEFGQPYYRKGGSAEDIQDGYYWSAMQMVTAPPVRAGEIVLFRDKLDNSRAGWQYLVGQRRVRRAPTLCCDTPNFVNSGVDFFDQPFVFFGPMDRYDWKIVGKKEMYIPYNNNRLIASKDADAIKPNFVNPELVRWELHRVWEVEGTLRAGQRDVRPRRKLYFDEDTHIAVIGNTWDGQGTLWHTSVGFPFIMYEYPTVEMEVFTTMDFIKGTYTFTPVGNHDTQIKIMDKAWPEGNFTPESLSRRGVR